MQLALRVGIVVRQQNSRVVSQHVILPMNLLPRHGMWRVALLLSLLVFQPDTGQAQRREESLRVAVGGDTLAGTLTLPPGNGPYPAVVLLSGMLQDTRDAPSAGFRTFKVLADTLSSLGMAVLRYDDRGVGESGGRNTWQYVLDDHAAEAAVLMAWLRSRDDIDPARVGLLGHSYGGPIAARAARRGESPAFVVLASPHVLKDRDIVLGMIRRQELARGRSSEEAEAEAAFLDATIGLASRGERDWDDTRQAIRQHLQPRYELLPDSVRQRRSLDDYVSGTLYGLLLPIGPTPMWRYFWDLDLSADYASITAPVLAFFGERDGQVVSEENVPLLRAAIPGGADERLTVGIVPEANHYLRAPRTPPGQFAPGFIDALAEWLRANGFIP